jgi:hypothetical protein
MTDNIPRIYIRRSPLANLACSYSFLTVLFLGKLFNACCDRHKWQSGKVNHNQRGLWLQHKVHGGTGRSVHDREVKEG